MSNKRIEKKRAKAEMLRDKVKVIASMIAVFDSDKPYREQRRNAKWLMKMDLDELMRFNAKVMEVWLPHPLRYMYPGGVLDVRWR